MRPDGSAPVEEADRTKASKAAKPPRRKPRGGANDNDVGKVLRSVYQKAVDEDIPAEMLDLLSKLD